MAATYVRDKLGSQLKVVSIGSLGNLEYSELIDTLGATSVFITVTGADVDMLLPNYDTVTDAWITVGTTSRTLEYLVVAGTAGAIKAADGVTYVGVIPGNAMPPKIQFYNTNAGNRSLVVYVSYAPGGYRAD